MITQLPERLRSKIEIQPCPITDFDDDCWIWTGALLEKRGGYGAVGYQSKIWRAHRLIYTLLVGPIDHGLELDHLCRNHPCCNPAHLDPVTHAVNLERGLVGRRKSHCVHGHALIGDNLFARQRQEGVRWECRTCIRNHRRRRWLARREQERAS